MARPRVAAAGGLAATMYVLRKGREAGGLLKLYKRLRSKNVCKTCALGMGGQKGGMVNEAGHFPEVCKKSVQAQAGDMAGAIGEEFLKATPLSEMAGYTSARLESLGRLTFPMLAEGTDTHFRRISWEEAFSRIVPAFQGAAREKVFFYSSGRSSNEAAYLLQLVARAYGTNNVHNCSFYCHAASGVALSQVYGSGTASVGLEDLAQADLAMIVGANPASNHPRLITQLMQMRRRGGKVIVVNPLKELGLVRFRVPSDWRSMLFGTQVSDLYLQPHIGGDVALHKAILKGIMEAGAVDRGFVETHATGWAEVAKDLQASKWDDLVAASGVQKADILRAADMIRTSRRGIFLWAMGLTHHANGVDNILSLANIALARGWLGKPGCGLLPIRGHSNVQGVGSVGVSPTLKKAFAEKLSARYGITVSEGTGQDTYASMAAAHEGKIEAAFLLGGNLYSSNPDSRWAAEAMRRIPLSAHVTTKLNEGHIHGRGETTVILPALARDEEPQATTQESMFNFVRLSDGGTPAVSGEMKSEVEIIATLAERILPAGKYDWSSLRSHEALRREIAAVVPGFEPLTQIGETKREFVIEGRVFREPKFATADGKARFHATPLPPPSVKEGEFRLMTIRSEGQFNTVVYDEEDLYRGNKRRDVVMMALADAVRLALKEGDRVIVESETGRMEASVAVTDIRAGNVAMYYPEANVLVPRKLDPRSKTPAFKMVPVRISPAKS